MSARLTFKCDDCQMCHMVEGCSSDSPWFFGVLYRIARTKTAMCACQDFFPFSAILCAGRTATVPGSTVCSMVQGTCWSTSRIAPKRCVVVERCRILPASRPLGHRLRRHWGDRIEPLACAIHKVWVRWFRKCNHCSIAVFSPTPPPVTHFLRT